MQATQTWHRLESDYLSQHANLQNRRLHAIGVPAIVLSILLALHGCRAFDLALVVTLAFGVSYFLAARGEAFFTLVLLALAYLGAHGIVAVVGGEVPWLATGALFCVGWVFQLWGHRVEGNRPALLTNLRHIWVAPMALVREAVRRER